MAFYTVDVRERIIQRVISGQTGRRNRISPAEDMM